MRLIDANALKEKINTTFWSEIGAIIDNAPTKDAVEVVRCKDCRWYERHKAKIFENCCRNNYLIPMKPNDYCSYGEHKAESEVEE